MKRRLNNHTFRYLPLNLALIAGMTLSLPTMAGPVALATAPLITATTTTVKPNVMFILDDSGSMGWDYLPDWVRNNHPTTGTAYDSMAELFTNSGFNGVAYNPAVTYTPPVLYNADGTFNTTTYPSQTGMATATGADAAIKPNWNAVKDDAYGVQSTASSNLTSTASFYTFVPGEYCSTDRMTRCVVATAPITVSEVVNGKVVDVVYDKAAGVRWCNSAALTTCQSINDATYKYPRYPGLSLGGTGVRPTALLTFKNKTANTNPGSVIKADLPGTASVKLGTIIARSTAITIGKNKVASDVAKAVVAAIGTGGVIQAYVGGNAITPTCKAASTATVCLVDTSSPSNTNGNSITLGTITLPGSLTSTKTASAGGTPGSASAVPGSNPLTNIVPATTSYAYPGTAAKHLKRSDCAGTTCTYAEEMTNYANWWTYYHTRLQAMKTSVSRAFKVLDNKYRVGFTTISDVGATNGAKFLGNATFELAHKNAWFTKLFATKTAGSTPLRGALSKAGRYYGNKIASQVDPVQYSCQQNFTILSTDGYWNTGNESTSYGPLNMAGGKVGNLDGGSTGTLRPKLEGTTAVSDTLADVSKYYYDTDLRTGPGAGTFNNCAGAVSPDFPAGNPDVCTNNVRTTDSDSNASQHMASFTMGLGIDGTLVYTSDYETATAGDFNDLKSGTGTPTVNWADPIAGTTGERIDDLWHAAVNGNGIYFSAKSPDEIVDGFTRSLKKLDTNVGSAAAAATSTLNPVAGNNFAYVASYTNVEWKGNLEARDINVDSGVVSETARWCVENIKKSAACALPNKEVKDSSGSALVYYCSPIATDANSSGGIDKADCTLPSVFDAASSTCRDTSKDEIAFACTGTMPTMVNASVDKRKIYTAPQGALIPLSGQNLVPFDAAFAAANPTNFNASHINMLSQWGSLSAPQQTDAANGTNLVNYLRGQPNYEKRTSNTTLANHLFRSREAVMGDALESQPVFIGEPIFNYTDAGFGSFKSSNAGRTGIVYMGANDGMLHAFYAKDKIIYTAPAKCVVGAVAGDYCGGEEVWAYVPSMVVPNMWKLADWNYNAPFANLHANFINGSPIVSDVCATPCASAADWHTILVGGLNGGGRGYYALDVTDPLTPKLLWEFTDTNGDGTVKDANLGYSFGNPVITKKADGTWVVLLTSGYNNTSPGDGRGYLYVLDALNGTINAAIATTETLPSSGLAKIATWNDAPSSNQAGFTYGGDLEGNVWRFNINGANPAAIGNGDVIKYAVLKDPSGNTQPVTTAPVLGDIGGKRVVFVGTGKYLEVSDLTDTQVQSQYAIKDDNTPNLNNPGGSPRDSTVLVKQTLSVLTDTTTRATTNNTVNFDTGRGWYTDFPAGERVNIDSNLVLGTLIVPTIVPKSSVCSPGGEGWLNYFNYETGGAVTDIVSQKYLSPIVGVNVIYIQGKPIVEVVTANKPTPKIPKTAVSFGSIAGKFSSKRAIWRELTPP
jgi:type IV pilus assembly protein PilY1